MAQPTRYGGQVNAALNAPRREQMPEGMSRQRRQAKPPAGGPDSLPGISARQHQQGAMAMGQTAQPVQDVGHARHKRHTSRDSALGAGPWDFYTIRKYTRPGQSPGLADPQPRQRQEADNQTGLAARRRVAAGQQGSKLRLRRRCELAEVQRPAAQQTAVQSDRSNCGKQCVPPRGAVMGELLAKRKRLVGAHGGRRALTIRPVPFQSLDDLPIKLDSPWLASNAVGCEPTAQISTDGLS